MLARLLDHTTRGARLAVLLAVAMVAGVVLGSAVLAPTSSRVLTVVGGSDASPTADVATPGESGKPEKVATPGESGKPEKSVKPDDVGKPDEAAGSAKGAGAGGVHGACVSKVARDKGAVGGPHHNHGWAVSRAAHTCPHPTPSAPVR